MKRFTIILISILTLFFIFTPSHADTSHIQTTHSTIQSITFDLHDNTYYAHTGSDASEWSLPLLKYPYNNQTIIDQFQHDLIGKSVTIQYDDNGGSDNFEDWSVESWSVDDVQYK